MSHTIRRGMVTCLGTFFKDTMFTFNRYWFKHDPAWYRRELNRSFRHREKQYFERFGETLVKTKNRGWYW